MRTIRFSVAMALVAFLGLLLDSASAVPQNRATAKKLTAQQQAAAKHPQGITTATDGSTILDTNVTVNGLNLRFYISAPADQFTTASSVPGGQQAPGAPGRLGINLLLHGDGAVSYFDRPNQAVQGGLMGVGVLAPSESLLWGVSRGGPTGLSRPDGAAHMQALHDLVQTVLPQLVAFNAADVLFSGVSGGSLVLSGFFVPAHGASYLGGGGRGGGVLLMCGALAPQVAVVDAARVFTGTRIHYQSSQNELPDLQRSIPQAVAAYLKLAQAAGLDDAAIGRLQTADNTPLGGHCEFDGKDFQTGVQLIESNFQNIMQGGDGKIQQIPTDTVLKSVVGNTLKYGGKGKK